MMANFSIDEWLILIIFGIIYVGLLCYDLFKRTEKLGYLAYIAALGPANYLWFLVTKNAQALDFGATGAMAILSGLWILCVIRDIFIRKVDADDVALVMLVALVIQLIMSAVLPAIPGLAALKESTTTTLNYFYLPNISTDDPLNLTALNMILLYKIMATVLTLMIVIPIVVDLKGTPIKPFPILIITLIFLAPFAYISYLWLPSASWVLLILIEVLFFFLLLALAKKPDPSSETQNTPGSQQIPPKGTLSKKSSISPKKP
jgi:hypothetical protein